MSGDDTGRKGTSSQDSLCSEGLPQSPTLECDGGNDAAAAAAVVAWRLPSSLLIGCGLPGSVVVVVEVVAVEVLGKARRIDEEAQLCIS